MNILVVKLSSLGDIVLATPCLSALRARWPSARIVVAVNTEFVPLLAACPVVDGLLVRRGTHRVRRLKTLCQAAWAGLANRRPRFDLAIDLQGNFHSNAWTSLSGARRKAGLGVNRRGWEFSIPPNHGLHAVDLAASVLERLGVAVPERVPRLTVSDADDLAVETFLRRRGLPTRGFVVVHPFTAWDTKEWPADRYATMLRRIAVGAAGGPAVIVTGSAGEVARARALCAAVASPRIDTVAGELPLGQCLALWSRAALFIGGDTGPMHASAALGVPVVTLFGPTLPEVTGPVGKPHRVVQASRPATHDAYRSPEGRRHMLAIPIEKVLDAVHELLSDPAQRVA